MFPEERKQKIYDLVCAKKSIKVSELSQLLDISEVTIRKDLDELHRQNKLMRTHGGAIAMYSVGAAVSALELIQSNKNIEEKKRIAQLAYSHVKDKDTIFVDGSSTVYELVKLIAAGKRKNLMIITTSLLTVNALADCDNVTVMMLGGEINYEHYNVQGHITSLVINSLRADKSFIGINGIDEAFGYSTPRFADAEQKAAMLRASMQAFILADRTKFGKTYLAKVDADCDYIITDAKLPGYSYEWLDEKCAVCFADSH